MAKPNPLLGWLVQKHTMLNTKQTNAIINCNFLTKGFFQKFITKSIMTNSVTYDIKLNVVGGDEINKLPAKIGGIGDAIKPINNTLEPLAKIINLLENTNKILMAIGRVSVESFNQMSKVADNTSNALQKTDNALDKMNDKMKSTPGQSFTQKVAGIGQALIGLQAIASSVGGVLRSVFDEGMARETASINFGTLFNDREKGKAYADTLRNTDAAALYGASTVNDAAKGMLSFGIDSETTLETIERLGDIAMGDAQKLGSLSLAFAQISSAGKLGGQDLMQLINAGFNPLEEISKKTGKSIGELKDEMSKGAISAQDVADAIKSATSEGGKFNGALKDVMDNTLEGKMARMQGMMDDLKAKIFALVLPLAEKLMPIVEKLLPLVEKFIPVLEGVFAILEPIAEWISENVDTLFTLATAIGAVAGVIALCTSPITGTVIAIAALIYILVELVNHWNEWADAVMLICPPLYMVIELIMTVKRYWDSIVEAFKSDGIVGGLKRIGECILDFMLKPVQKVLGWLGELTGWDWMKSAEQSVAAYRKVLDAPNEAAAHKKEEQGGESGGVMASLMASVNGGNGGATTALSDATGAGTSAVASGGTRNTQITINLGNMVESINFEGGVEENKESLTSQLEETLLRVLYSAQMAV